MYSFSASIAASVSSDGRSIVSVAETQYKNKTRLVHKLKVLLKTKTRTKKPHNKNLGYLGIIKKFFPTITIRETEAERLAEREAERDRRRERERSGDRDKRERETGRERRLSLRKKRSSTISRKKRSSYLLNWRRRYHKTTSFQHKTWIYFLLM
ncbi:hypothetical protein YC2023_115090 [Brassica napus]